ncbi:MAG: hypothetical protein K0R81_424 [Microbacterium sp.]|jgi:hypothetical protein|nr:hypothetical protein [Microbacterium sp.]
MTPEQAREQTVSVLQGTIEASGESDWVLDAKGSPLPGPCSINGEDGVTFSLGAYSTAERTDPAADAQNVADYWASIGIPSRIVSDPVPRVFGGGGPVNAISFSTAPTYAISVGGICVPGNPFDYYDDGYRAASPTP